VCITRVLLFYLTTCRTARRTTVNLSRSINCSTRTLVCTYNETCNSNHQSVCVKMQAFFVDVLCMKRKIRIQAIGSPRWLKQTCFLIVWSEYKHNSIGNWRAGMVQSTWKSDGCKKNTEKQRILQSNSFKLEIILYPVSN